MKVAHVVWGMKTGGVETMLVNIINEQVKTEEVRLFIVNDFVDDFVMEKISPKCKVVCINRQPKKKDYLKILVLNIKIWLFKPNILHLHSNRISQALFGRWNFVRTIHGLYNKPDDYSRMKSLYAISDVVAEYTLKQGFKSTVIPNGIKVAEMNTKIGCSNACDIFHLVQVSRLYTKAKGQDVFLNALKILINQGFCNFVLHFVGAGPSEQELRKMTSDLGLDEYVSFEGLKSQEYIYKHLCDYDLFVQPSRYEGFGLTIAEAMAAKLPVLVSDIQGPMEVIGFGKYGLSFKCGDAADLAEKLKVVLQGGYDYSLIDKAYHHVREAYDVSTTAQRYLQEYRKLL